MFHRAPVARTGVEPPFLGSWNFVPASVPLSYGHKALHTLLQTKRLYYYLLSQINHNQHLVLCGPVVRSSPVTQSHDGAALGKRF